jgi:hypothetical protein
MKKGRASILAAVSAALLVPLAAPSIIRMEIDRKAAEMGVAIKYDGVSLSSTGIRLSKVEASRGETEAHLESVTLGVDKGLRLVRIEGKGGAVKARVPKEGGTGRATPATEIALSDVSIEIAGVGMAEGARVERRKDGSITAEARRVKAEREGARVSATGVSGTYEAGKLKARVESASVELEEMGERRSSEPAGERRERDVEVEIARLEISTRGHRAVATNVTGRMGGGKKEAEAKLVVVDDKFTAEDAYGGVEKGDGPLHVVLSAKSLKTSNAALTDKEISTGIIGCDLREVGGPVRRVEGTVSLGGASVDVVASTDGKRAWVSVTLPENRCQDLLESAPPVMVDKLLPGTVLTGNIAADLQVEFDLPNREKPEARIRLKNGCRIQDIPQQFKTSLLRKPFKRTVYDPERRPREEVTGPGSAEWRPLDTISRFLPLAVKTTEDPGFWAHRGFDIRAMENSIVDNVRSGRFSRGASTITMQLAKNLWLYRQKTLSRKLQELVLTTYLEQSLTKEEILELYLNVVELGPNVYGIGEASMHYFGTVSSGLSLSQSVFIASVLPSPNESFFGQDGRLRPGRLAFVRRIIQLMLERHLITKEEFDEGMREIPVLDSPKPALEGEEILTKVRGISPNDWN